MLRNVIHRFAPLILVLMLLLAGCDESYHGRLRLLPPHNIPMIAADSLAGILQNQQVVLLDVRNPEEQAVSQLPGAIAIEYEGFIPQRLDSLDSDRPIVVYCTVGFRSGNIGEQLQRVGFSRVSNLYGGILEWKNRGHAVVTPSGQPTEQVHTYSSYWAGYLERGEAVY
ncbi:rhodanese-like domain-containing protein [Cesiribacter andamanensis]|nr:rhodanese-like domain-containing protein [Cesiribacter andamanensis]